MNQRDRCCSWVLTALLVSASLTFVPARLDAAVTSNSGAAIVAYPYLEVDGSRGIDTFIQLTNTSSSDIDVLCFYENTTAHCAGTTQACRTVEDCNSGIACEPRWAPLDFKLHIFQQQPVSWRAGQGESPIPEPGSGTIPAVPEDPFVGALRCIAINAVGGAVASNVLSGNATVEQNRTDAKANFDVAKYNAIGVRTDSADTNGDGRLQLGGATPEYQGCATTLILDPLFDQAVEPVLRTRRVRTTLVLLPCSADYVNATPGQSTVSYTVTNELATTIAAAQPFAVAGQLVATLDAPELQVGVQGTLTGLTRLQASGAGVVAIAFETHLPLDDSPDRKTAARIVRGIGERATADVIVIASPPPLPSATPTTTPTEGEPTPTTTSTQTASPSPTASATAESTASATPESSVTPSTPPDTATATPTPRFGDLNLDGVVNAADLQLLIAEVFDGDGAAAADAAGGTVHSGPEADANGDATITSADFVALLKMAE